jgi:hypothetical protein
MIRSSRPWLTALLVFASVAGAKAAPPVDTPPFASAEIYLTPFSHLDFYWRGTREDCLARGNRIIAERVRVPIPNSFPIVVFNPLGWTRDDVVKAHLKLFGDVAPADIGELRKGIRLLDEAGNAVPFYVQECSGNISRALQLVFAAKGIPSLGCKTYYVVAGAAPSSFSPAARLQLDQDMDRRDPRRPVGSDTVENRFYWLTVDRVTGRGHAVRQSAQPGRRPRHGGVRA